VFTFAEAEELLERVTPLNLPVILTVRPLLDAHDAGYVREELRLAVPDSVIEQLREEPDSGTALAADLALRLKPKVAGIRIEGTFPEAGLAVARMLIRGSE
jgi:homocysteine S-methyltransferase